jgi:ABC-2 type transport system ATP-binding protein
VTTAVSVENIRKRFARTQALDGVTLRLGDGVTGLLGPNGAGKTTMLRILATVLAPDDGRVRMLGLDPADPRERTELRRQLGYLPQDPGFQRGFSVFAFVDREGDHRHPASP